MGHPSRICAGARGQARAGTAGTIGPGLPATIGRLGNCPIGAVRAIAGTARAPSRRVDAPPGYAQAMTRSPRPWLASGQPPRSPAPRGLVAGASSALRRRPAAAPRSRSSRFDPASAVHDRRPPARRLPGPRGAAARPRTRARRPTTWTRGATARPRPSARSPTPGIDGVRFAGATWGLGGTSGLTVAAFEGDGPRPGDDARLLQARARGTDRHTEKLLDQRRHRRAARRRRRLDVLASDGAGQTVVAWPADRPDTVFVLLAADLGDAAVLAALDEFAAR